MVSKKKTTGVLDFLQSSLPRKALQELYMEESRGQYVCRSVLQIQTLTAQQVVLRLQCTGNSFPVNGIKVWSKQNDATHASMLKQLYQWAIIQDFDSGVVSLTVPFSKGIRSSLCSLDASPWRPLEPIQLAALEQEAGVSLDPITPEDLERYTVDQWDSVLHFLVGSSSHKEPPSSMVEFLLQTGLMQVDPDYRGRDPKEAPLVITESGYDYMLQDNYEQVWHFVVQYLSKLEEHPRGEELRKEALLLLISLSFAKVGGAYLTSSLNKSSKTMVKDLSQFGLLYIRKIGKAKLFYPTRAAMQLVGRNINAGAVSTVWSLSNKALNAALSDPKPTGSSHLGIIVQTNFQLAAYTTSELHVSMLGLFCDVGTIRRLPNVVFMHITRDSIKSAFSLGIHARQILRFLEKHTHPKCRNVENSSPVPSNVVDQIWLWDREQTRVVFTKVYTHECLMGAQEFRAVAEYAQERGALAWQSDRRQQLMLDYKYVDRMQAFARQWRAQAVSRQQQD